MSEPGRHPLAKIVSITPSSIDAFSTCPRRYANQQLFGTPSSDGGPANAHGLVVHDLLHRIHTAGSCHDAAVVDAALAAADQDTEVNRTLIARHARRCPVEHDHAFHEKTYVRFHRSQPMFLASARYDAIWVRGDIVDVREYKTGVKWFEDLAEDRRAVLQAWILAERVHRSGKRLRLRYEYLSPEIDEDPDVWEPGDDDLESLTDRIHAIVRAMHASDWRGVHEPTVCKWCPYRSVCPDSALPGAPIWPVLGIDP